jgi:hypothetical protein
MITSNRRVFLGGFGSTLLAAGIAPALGRRRAWQEGRLDFGELEGLAALMQERAPEELQPLLIEKLKGGTTLETLVAAGALANARTFGGEDYTGYHCMMALMPAYAMAQELPAAERPLPVLKVLYRNATRIQEEGGRAHEVLHALPRVPAASQEDAARRLRAAFLERDVQAAEEAFLQLVRHGPAVAYDELQTNLLQENLDVHRVVLAWRAWEVLQLTGAAHAETLLRQSVRFCIADERERLKRGRPTPELRELLPELLGRHALAKEQPEPRALSEADLDGLSEAILAASPKEAAELVAARLAAGVSPADVGEALSLAANTLLRHDPGRPNRAPGRPVGSVHGASIGVHASDAARAWRNIAAVSGRRNAMASLIAGAHHTAGQKQHVGARPFGHDQAPVETKDAAELLRLLRAAIEDGEQARAMAVTQAYCELGHAAPPVFALLLGYGVDADGALHAEKYYRTVREDHATSRPAFRARHLVALARVTASEHGDAAPGLAEARERLG